MAFESLADKLQNTFRKLKGKGKISEKDLKDAMREVKLALLEADVNFKVVKDFVRQVSERASGAEVMESLTPAQQVIKIVNEELVRLMGGTEQRLSISSKPPTVIMMAGLQGAGKTTTAAKLGGLLKKQGKRPLLCACDVYRPAAVKQLQIVGGKLDLPVFAEEGCTDAVKIAKDGLAHALAHANDILIIDTAGRLHIDEALMNELKEISKEVKPTEILLVVDAMTGQDAVNVADAFNKELEIGGVILTKLDGDTRGGAALSVRAVTNKPIKFCGMGEKLTDLEVFHPDRMASRILGMGDMLSLIEKAEQALDMKKAEELERKLRTQQFTFTDFLDQMEQMKNMGPLQNVLGMLPGVNAAALKNVDVDEKRLARIEAIIKAMTPRERDLLDKLTPSRKERIARGSGTGMNEVNALIKQFEQMQKMMKQLSGGMSKKMKKNRGFFGKMPGGFPR
ncbi:signal recognition particle protein [Ructibacterium gallinarum]|uniref:Signal recognition particle protein n=1 Tax=Ructibacterium gallinarum TaxID=2779355 RepID=A0A9D5R8D0_9FIRM|nr:signal recognition particle protein [Ructibacterium gallinarum]MBE5040286.1 signal recognition particle protein [Ructibacterium gallinarum]